MPGLTAVHMAQGCIRDTTLLIIETHGASEEDLSGRLSVSLQAGQIWSSASACFALNLAMYYP